MVTDTSDNTVRGFAESTVDLRHHINGMRPHINRHTPAQPLPAEPDPHQRLSRNQVRWAFICTTAGGILIGALGTLAALDVRNSPTAIPDTLVGLGRAVLAFLAVVALILLSTRSAVQVIVQRLDRNHAQAETNAAAMRQINVQLVGLASGQRRVAQAFLTLIDAINRPPTQTRSEGTPESGSIDLYLDDATELVELGRRIERELRDPPPDGLPA